METTLEKSVGNNNQEKKIDGIFDYIQSVTNNNFDRNNEYRKSKELEDFTKESYVEFIVDLWKKTIESSKQSVIDSQKKIDELKRDFTEGSSKIQQSKENLQMRIESGDAFWVDFLSKQVKDLEEWYSPDSILDRISVYQGHISKFEENVKILEEQLEKISEMNK